MEQTVEIMANAEARNEQRKWLYANGQYEERHRGHLRFAMVE